MKGYYGNADQIPALVERLYAIAAELEELFPGKRSTPDGHMVGSLGEVLAAHRYGLELLSNSAERHDAKSRTGKLVQVKATQVGRVALGSEPEHLVVLRLEEDGSAEEVFNGPGSLAWENASPMGKNGQRPILLSMLRSLMNRVLDEERLPVINP